jgi:hypothetical protein
MPSVDEYVETIVSEGFEREIEQEENIVRSLPFCATSLGILAAALSLILPALCPPARDVFTIVTYGLLATLGCTFLVLFFYLFRSVWPRRVAYPINGTDLLSYADKLRAYYAKSEAAPEIVESAMIADIREIRIQQIAEATRWNRKRNVPRLRARDRAITVLIFSVLLAFFLLGIIFLRDAIAPGECGARSSEQRAAAASDQNAARPGDRRVGAEAFATAAPHGAQGRLGLRGT